MIYWTKLERFGFGLMVMIVCFTLLFFFGPKSVRQALRDLWSGVLILLAPMEEPDSDPKREPDAHREPDKKTVDGYDQFGRPINEEDKRR